MKLTKSQLKQIIKETIQEGEWKENVLAPEAEKDWGDARFPTPELPPEFDTLHFSEIVSDAVDQIGGRKVLEIVNEVIKTLEV